MTSEAGKYEQLRSDLEALPLPHLVDERKTIWVIERLLGVAKTSSGAIELFLVGARLNARLDLVRRHLDFGRWQASRGEVEIDANRLVLPSEPQFLPIAALICVELLHAGLASAEGLQAAFERVEPIVQLALRRTALAPPRSAAT